MNNWSPKPWESSLPRSFRHQRRSRRFEGICRRRRHQRRYSFLRSVIPCVQGVEHHSRPSRADCRSRAYIAREAASDSFSEGAGVVAEGRDITTVVAPDAEVRVLLTAREEVRQARRSGQSTDGVGSENVAARDAADSKVTNFTSAAEGVLTVDNSDLNSAKRLMCLCALSTMPSKSSSIASTLPILTIMSWMRAMKD